MTKALARLAEEAEAFSRIARKVISEETLEQRSRPQAPRFRPRIGGQGAQPAEPRFRERTIVSEYAFSSFADSPGVLHEFRQIISVDGRPVRNQETARRTLSMGLSGRDDRVKRQMVREFQNLGLAEAVVDLGQILLLFSERRLSNYEFAWTGQGQVLGERAAICSFRQTGGTGAVTIFEKRQARQELLQGEIWLREPDFRPLRVVLRTQRQQQGHTVRDEATVDYSMSSHGALTPDTVLHREHMDDRLQVENLFRYKPFRMFSADVEIEFKEYPLPPSKRP